jgi:hypothetical protein
LGGGGRTLRAVRPSRGPPCAHFVRVDPARADMSADNLHLVCIDCVTGYPDLLDRLTVASDVVQALSEKLRIAPGEAMDWLARNLQAFGVLTRAYRQQRSYLLPGVGVFDVDEQALRVGRVAAIRRLEKHQDRSPRLPPPVRSRGLPLPDRTAWLPALRRSPPRYVWQPPGLTGRPSG